MDIHNIDFWAYLLGGYGVFVTIILTVAENRKRTAVIAIVILIIILASGTYFVFNPKKDISSPNVDVQPTQVTVSPAVTDSTIKKSVESSNSIVVNSPSPTPKKTPTSNRERELNEPFLPIETPLLNSTAPVENTVMVSQHDSPSQNSPPDNSSPKYIPIDSIEFSRSTPNLKVGESQTFAVTVFPLNATNKDVRWSALDNNIISVTQDGLVTGINPGETAVQVYSDTDGKIGRHVVRVEEVPKPSPSPIPYKQELIIYSPSNNEIIYADNTTISWSNITNANLYELIIVADGDGHGIVETVSGSTNFHFKEARDQPTLFRVTVRALSLTESEYSQFIQNSFQIPSRYILAQSIVSFILNATQ
ncbi:MAG: inlA [Paenibacillaceae bacterium]|jgi:hypothetical protein|nr:inlA [Paenibacillaceae bacterium]